jgi:hypothetical protein
MVFISKSSRKEQTKEKGLTTRSCRKTAAREQPLSEHFSHKVTQLTVRPSTNSMSLPGRTQKSGPHAPPMSGTVHHRPRSGI